MIQANQPPPGGGLVQLLKILSAIYLKQMNLTSLGKLQIKLSWTDPP
jgi:hypothetical protein